MLKQLFTGFILCTLLGCSDLDDFHNFNYKIEGSAEKVDNMFVIMGPGIRWDSGEAVDLPIDIEHDVNGNNLDYEFEVTSADPNRDVTIKVYIDDVLIEEKSEWVESGSSYKMTISGVFSGE